MLKGNELVILSHCGLGRYMLVRQVVPTRDRKPCHYCGLKTGRFRYGAIPDDRLAGRVDWFLHAFCSVGCLRNY